MSIESVLTSPNVIEVHHIGSTSVKGLCAKPIIDILIEVKSLEVLDTDSDGMETLDYLAKGEFGIVGRRYFQKGEVQRSHQVHAFTAGSVGAQRHLAFHDYLLEFSDIAAEYGCIKQKGLAICGNDIEIYINHKNSFIKEHETKALLWKFA